MEDGEPSSARALPAAAVKLEPPTGDREGASTSPSPGGPSAAASDDVSDDALGLNEEEEEASVEDGIDGGGCCLDLSQPLGARTDQR